MKWMLRRRKNLEKGDTKAIGKRGGKGREGNNYNRGTLFRLKAVRVIAGPVQSLIKCDSGELQIGFARS